MKKTKLDTLIEKKEMQIYMKHTLDYVNTEEDILADIYSQIDGEASSLIDGGKYKYNLSLKYKMSCWLNARRENVRNLDRRLQKSSFYNKYIRKGLYRIYSLFSKKEKGIYIPSILKLKDELFVEELYRQVLCREPDKDGLEYNVLQLKEKKSKKIDMFYAFYNSEENTIKRRLKGQTIAKILYRNK